MVTTSVKTSLRAPFDDFHWHQLQTFLTEYNQDCDAHYLWSGHNYFKKALSTIKQTSKQVVLCIKDNWRPIIQPDKDWIVLTGVENLKLDCTVIPMGGCIMNQYDEWRHTTPLIDKSPEDEFICLTAGHKTQRILVLSYLLGLNIGGMLSRHNATTIADNLLDQVDWDFDTISSDDMDILHAGYTKLASGPLLIDSNYIYKQTPTLKTDNDNWSNWQRNLTRYYQNTCVEIVNETLYLEPYTNITEKFRNSVFGCNIPIVISNIGTVDFLRSLGFDMFDDVVDNSHDKIEDPALRAVSALKNNQTLLELSLPAWRSCRERFIHNINVLNEIPQFFKSRLIKLTKEISQ